MEVNRILMGLNISIHAPREGCDLIHDILFRELKISIHAPREGCDAGNPTAFTLAAGFQSTHPARGATWVVPWA